MKVEAVLFDQMDIFQKTVTLRQKNSFSQFLRKFISSTGSQDQKQSRRPPSGLKTYRKPKTDNNSFFEIFLRPCAEKYNATMLAKRFVSAKNKGGNSVENFGKKSQSAKKPKWELFGLLSTSANFKKGWFSAKLEPTCFSDLKKSVLTFLPNGRLKLQFTSIEMHLQQPVL